MDFDLRLLRHARALADEGSFARAARTLHLTQPALSRSIQELERRTGIRLFDRNKGQVEPTDLGRVFLTQARELLTRAEALDRDVATMRGSATGSLVLGSGTFPTSLFTAQAVATFLQSNPDVRIRVVNDNWVALIAALHRRELDFVVAASPMDEEAADLDVRRLSVWQGRFLVRPGHPLLGNGDAGVDDIGRFPLVCSARLPAAFAQALLTTRRADKAGRSIPAVGCESHQMMRAIVLGTDHVMLSVLALHASAVESGALVPLPVADPRFAMAFAVLRQQSRTLLPIADELIRAIAASDQASAAQERELASRCTKRKGLVRARRSSTRRAEPVTVSPD
jgi:DNA-binding transcriptional LysR family regulator